MTEENSRNNNQETPDSSFRWNDNDAGDHVGSPLQKQNQTNRTEEAIISSLQPLDSPQRIPAPSRWPTSDPLDSLKLLSSHNWSAGLAESWVPGETGARARLDHFFKHGLSSYDKGRDYPASESVSHLSPHLHFGEISPRRLWFSVQADSSLSSITGAEEENIKNFERQIIWREFAHHLLYHFPTTAERCLYAEYDHFPWKKNLRHLAKWQRGETGIPLVDAGMRELWQTGWMHNRVRMIVASVLVKNLLIPWQEGAHWFWNTLVDADLANNTFGWQWVAGCGADAAPYFRVFNSVTQGKKFDSDGNYVRKWIPELQRLPNKWIHRPWEAPVSILKEAGIVLGQNYPRPIMTPEKGRSRALAAWKRFKSRL